MRETRGQEAGSCDRDCEEERPSEEAAEEEEEEEEEEEAIDELAQLEAGESDWDAGCEGEVGFIAEAEGDDSVLSAVEPAKNASNSSWSM
jgi:hypothetical protein